MLCYRRSKRTDEEDVLLIEASFPYNNFPDTRWISLSIFGRLLGQALFLKEITSYRNFSGVVITQILGCFSQSVLLLRER